MPFISHLSARCFRNLSDVSLSFSRHLNILYGDNGQGKTNILEAMALCCTLKPLRLVPTSRDLIQFGKDRAHIHVKLESTTSFDIDLTIEEKGKQVKLSQKNIRDSHSIAKHVSTVIFVPEDLHIVTGSASFRRRALDQLTYALFPTYLDTYRRYERALSQRNRLLKEAHIDRLELNSFTLVLVELGAVLLQDRIRALNMWLKPFQEQLAAITDEAATSHLSYTSSFLSDASSIDDIQKQFLQAFEQSKEQELIRRTTLHGPHLDDVLITLNEKPARLCASRGQARALVLSLKLAQLKLVSEFRQMPPIVLLDDVVGELDPHHARRLMQVIEPLDAQTFITTTHLEALTFSNTNAHVFHVSHGAIL